MSINQIASDQVVVREGLRVAYRLLRNGVSSNTRAAGGTCIVTTWRQVEARVTHALYAGRLTLLAAKVVGIELNESGTQVRYRQRSQSGTQSMQVDAIVDCTGLVRDLCATTNPAVPSLFDQGLARADQLSIGIETSAHCAIVSRGQSSTSATNVPNSPPNSSASTSKTDSSASPSC